MSGIRSIESVAVVIPSFNRGAQVGAAIESVLSQTHRPGEVLVVDDGSTDDTGEIVAGFGNHVRYIWQGNQGQAVARNRGVASSSSPWIAFLDSDDLWKPEKLARQLALALEWRVDVSFTDFSLIERGTRRGFESWHGELRRRGLQTCVGAGVAPDPLRLVVGPGDLVFMSTMLLTRTAFEEAGGFRAEFRRCQDFDLYLRLVVGGGVKIGFLDEILVERELAQNASSDTTYRFKLRALQDAYEMAGINPVPGQQATLRAALVHDSRALAGVMRRSGDVRGFAAALIDAGRWRFGGSASI